MSSLVLKCLSDTSALVPKCPDSSALVPKCLTDTSCCDQQLCTVYLCTVYASLSVSRNTAYETAAYNQKRLPTRPFLAECFCVLRSLYHFVFINELFSFLFQSSFDQFFAWWRQKRATLSTRHSKQHGHIGRRHGVAHVATSHRPALSASTA